jgi:hypothetical protein
VKRLNNRQVAKLEWIAKAIPSPILRSLRL